jgi:hypothetical protein
VSNRIPARPGTSIRHWLAVAFFACALLLVPGGQARAAPGDPPLLTLDPAAAPAGSQVTATITGFDACKPADGAQAGEVRLLWDGVDEVGSAPIDAGGASIPFLVPSTAQPAPHQVLAVCGTNQKLSAPDDFNVLAPTVQQVAVPSLIGLTLNDARTALSDAGLALGAVTGDRGVIRSQDPAPRTPVSRGTEVAVSVQATVVPPSRVRVRVPDVVGLSAKDAARVVTSLGLVLGGTTHDGLVIDQEPTPGTLVPVGSSVSLRVKADRGLPVLPLVLAGIVLAGVLVVLYRVIRARRSRTWTRNHVSVAPEHLTDAGSATKPAGHGPADDVVVRIDRHIDEGEHRLEEISQ